MISLQRIAKAIRRESLGGWLFYNQHHHDVIADKVLRIGETDANTRPWVYLFTVDREPVKIVHSIEEAILDHLEGQKFVYGGRDEFVRLLSREAKQKTSFAANFSAHYPRLSLLDHGTALLFAQCGFNLASAERLIQLAMSSLSADEIKSHEEASGALHRIIAVVWERIESVFHQGDRSLCEGEILDWIRELFVRFDLETEWPLIVGAGINTTLPHYTPQGRGARLARGDVLQLDIWGKKRGAFAIYADISWIGYLSHQVPLNVVHIFNVIRDARDKTVDFIRGKLEAQQALSGAEVDRYTESLLAKAGFSEAVRHRTGHAIDTEVHGFGVNLDAREFPDLRTLEEGSCFSIEPGLYLSDFGLRTEIDVYISNHVPVISGGMPQKEILCFKGQEG